MHILIARHYHWNTFFGPSISWLSNERQSRVIHPWNHVTIQTFWGPFFISQQMIQEIIYCYSKRVNLLRAMINKWKKSSSCEWRIDSFCCRWLAMGEINHLFRRSIAIHCTPGTSRQINTLNIWNRWSLFLLPGMYCPKSA